MKILSPSGIWNHGSKKPKDSVQPLSWSYPSFVIVIDAFFVSKINKNFFKNQSKKRKAKVSGHFSISCRDKLTIYLLSSGSQSITHSKPFRPDKLNNIESKALLLGITVFTEYSKNTTCFSWKSCSKYYCM